LQNSYDEGRHVCPYKTSRLSVGANLRVRPRFHHRGTVASVDDNITGIA